jgi:opacity protein-like surface antigen
MKKLLMMTASAALLSGAALAASQSESTEVFANVTPTCEIISQEAAIDLTAVAPDTWSPDADFTYQCNFVGSPTLAFSSQNSGLVNPSNGTDYVDYGVYLNDVDYGNTPSTSQKASDLPKSYGPGGDFGSITATLAPNTPVSPIFKVGPLGAFTVAGTYQDFLTITISP